MNVEEKIDKALIILEHIMEADPRTLRNPDCDNAWIFDKTFALFIKGEYIFPVGKSITPAHPSGAGDPCARKGRS